MNVMQFVNVKISAKLMIEVIKVKELILNCSNKSSAISLYVTNQHNNVIHLHNARPMVFIDFPLMKSTSTLKHCSCS